MSPYLVPLAYIDPGTGSFLLQILLAGLLGAAFTVKAFWGRIRALFGGGSSGDQKKTDE